MFSSNPTQIELWIDREKLGKLFQLDAIKVHDRNLRIQEQDFVAVIDLPASFPLILFTLHQCLLKYYEVFQVIVKQAFLDFYIDSRICERHSYNNSKELMKPETS